MQYLWWKIKYTCPVPNVFYVKRAFKLANIQEYKSISPEIENRKAC
jgi:hypothetical protein